MSSLRRFQVALRHVQQETVQAILLRSRPCSGHRTFQPLGRVLRNAFDPEKLPPQPELEPLLRELGVPRIDDVDDAPARMSRMRRFMRKLKRRREKAE